MTRSEEGVLEERGSEYEGLYYILVNGLGCDSLWDMLSDFEGSRVRITIETIEEAKPDAQH